MKIQHNLWAMNANRNIKINTGKSAKTTEKLSSGYRINRAADDAAGLSISEKMRRLIRGLTQASRNCQDGISMVQTAEGALNEVHDMLQRMNELAVQSANGTNAEADREALQQEFAQIQEEIDRVSQTTTFNAMRLFADEDSSTGTTNAGGTNGTNNTNGTGGANGTNNSNTPSVTSLDETQQQAPVMRTMSLRSVTRAASVQCGDFTVTGGVENVDFSFTDGVLTVLSDTAITIANTDSGTATTNRIVISDGVSAGNITLADVNFNGSGVGLTVNGNATVTLADGTTNVFNSDDNYGINISSNKGLVINGNGTLEAYGNGGFHVKSGTAITIDSGTIIAKAKHGYYAGIGAGYAEDAGIITINGGTITAQGGSWSAGIGGGCAHSWYYYGGNGGTIMINGGTINAQGGSWGAGIGGGCEGSGGTITINGGTINAAGGPWSGDIGEGSDGSSGTFSTGINGTAIINTSYISDKSNQSNWSGTVDGVTCNNTTPVGTGIINLSSLTSSLEITDKGYKLNGTWYAYTGEYQFSGTTGQTVMVTGSQKINLTGDVTVGTLTVIPGEKLTLNGSGKALTVTGTINNFGEIENNATIRCTGTINGGSNISGNGTVVAKGSGTINLSTLTGDLEIISTGYKIGGVEYTYTGSYNLSGTTTQEIIISSNASINIKDDTSIHNLNVNNGTNLSISGSEQLTLTGKLDNNGIINSSVVIDNQGMIDTTEGTFNNSGKIYKYGEIDGTITNVNNGKIVDRGTGIIDLNDISGDVEITDKGYKIGSDEEYIYVGTYKFSGTTDKNITISDDATVYLSEDISVKNLTVAEDASLSFKEESIYVSLRDLTVTGTLINNGTVTNDGACIINMGTIDTTNGTFTNNKLIKNWGIIKGSISGTGSIEQVGNGVIDLSQVNSELYISDGYYIIDGTTYNTTSSTYTFTGSTDAKVTIVNMDSNADITVVVPSNAEVGELAVSGNVEFVGSGTLSASELDIITPNTVTGNIPVIRGDGAIDLTGVSSVEITEDGYVIVDNSQVKKTYVHTGEITLSGTGYGAVIISGDRDISMNTANMSSLTIKDNSTVNLKLTGYNNINSGDGVIVEEGSTLNITGDGTLAVSKLSNQGSVDTDAKLTVKELDNDGAFENGGEITFSQNGSLLDNDGTFVNTGEITFENSSSGLDNGGTFVNENGGKIKNDSTTQNSGTLENSGEFYAGGTLNNTGTVQNTENGSLINSSGTENSGNITNDGSWECENVNNGSTGFIENDGEMINRGTIDNDGTVVNRDTLNNNSGTITNDGDMVNSGTVINNGYGTITNNGTLENGYGGVIDNAGTFANNGSGTVNNGGDITNQENANITNQGTVNNGSEGTIANAGTLDNDATINNDGAVNNYPTGTVDGTVNGNPVRETGSSDIDLSKLTGNLVITDTGYTIGDKAYVYTGDYNFTGSTNYDITIATSAKIVANGATGKNFSVTGNSNVEVVVTGGSAKPSSFEDVTVEEGSTLTFTQNTGEFGYANINGTLDNDGTFINNISGLSFGTNSEIDNDGTMEFNKTTNIYGDVVNDGKIITTTTVYVHGDCTNSASGTIESVGFSIEETGSLTNDGTIVQAGNPYSAFSVHGNFVNNNTFTNNTNTLVYAKGNVENNGTINNNGSFRSIGTVTNNGTFNNSGTFENVQEPSASGTVDNNGTITNSGTITNNGEMNNEDGDIRNEGSGTVGGSGTATGNPTVPAGSGTIDLNNLSGDLVIGDNGYTIGGVEYAYSGDYTFSGTTTQDITVTSDKKISFDNVTGSDLNIANGATVEISLTGDSTMENVSIANGSTLITDGTGNLTVTGTFENNGTYQNKSTLNNEGTFENSGEVENSGTVTNNGTVNNNSGSRFDNDGTVNNNNGSSFTNNGTVTNDGTMTGGNVTGNPPTGSGTGGGTGSGSGTGGSGGTGGGTGGGSGTGGTGGAVGTAKNSWWIQAGAEAGQGINIEIGAMNTKVLGIDKGTVNILTQESSGNAITAVSGAIEKLSEQRSRLGAYQNRLEHTIRNLDNVVENTTYAESRIRDADMAELMVEHANNNIIMQAAQAMLAQANHQPDGVLQLLQ